MRRITARLVGAGLLTAGLLLATVALVSADDETSDVKITVQGPVDAVSCGTPSTVTILGLSIDITNAAIDAESQSSGVQGSSDSQSSTDGQNGTGQGSGDTHGGDDGQSGDSGQSSGGCTALMVAPAANVNLSSDTPPLTATSVESSASDAAQVDLQAPLQAVDTTAKTITLLGLLIDVSNATVDGASDTSGDGNTQPLDLSQLMLGQSIEAKLDASQLPALVATSLEVKNFANQVRVEVDDTNGNPIDDVNEMGTPTNDVKVNVIETVNVQHPSTSAGSSARTKKLVRFQTASSGAFVLSGLPTGKATIVVARTSNGVTKTAHKQVTVAPNTARRVRLRLRSR